MITIYKTESAKLKKDEELLLVELRGLSTDEKPTSINGGKIENGSMFIEIDTGKIYMFDIESSEWKEI